MRYAQRGGYTPAGQQRRERLRLGAAGRFTRGDSVAEIAAELRVTGRTVRRWRRAWRGGGSAALRSRGPVSAERLSPQQRARLEAELTRGPLAHGFAGDQYRTLGRIKTLTGRLFPVGYTAGGTWKLMRRPGWPAQVPARQALERDEGAVAVWTAGVWPQVKAPRDLGAFLCSGDKAGQGLRPPKGRTWARRGARPVVTVRGGGGGRVSITGVVCYGPGHRPHLFCKLRVHHRRKGEAKSFSWSDYRDLITAAQRSLDAPVIVVWDNLSARHEAPP